MEVLSSVARHQPVQQNEITETVSLSKGSVSQALSALEEKQLVRESEQGWTLNEERILELYREHLEGFMLRKRESPQEVNQVRSLLKKDAEQVFEDRHGEIMGEITRVLSEWEERNDLELMNSVFKDVDRRIAEKAEDKQMLMIAVATDTTGEKETLGAQRARELLDE